MIFAHALDRSMMQALRMLSSSEVARQAAGAWLAAFEAAQAAGAAESVAQARAAAAMQRALSEESGTRGERSAMLAASRDARPTKHVAECARPPP
jgi:hypothetical protein